MPRKVLKDQYNVSEPDEQKLSELELEQDELFDVVVGNEAPKIQAPPNHVESVSNAPTTVAVTIVVPKKLSESSHTESNQERFFLYMILSVSTGILICLFVIIVRFIVHRRNGDDSDTGKMAASTTGETVLSSRASGDVEIDQKFIGGPEATAQTRLPSIIRDEVGGCMAQK